ncbi:SDR family NAD(P)-dependent oxidoreductase [Sphingobium yanoikuyae]|uniref:SDR family NAD(P)-dependent oxidoreductase n=1 Tax=Sphingobium yanoikuyae TaxID=13690 RepID=UPI00241FAC49|nr:SDR family NAD(P)-dependent oxidoreductase [Sphingobium yanoikuyae]
MKISGCAAVVTGGAGGLGEATARALADAGAKVAIFDVNAVLGAQVAAAIGGIFCQVDVTDETSVVEGFVKARQAHGQERILVNCAGTGSAFKTAWRARETGEISHFPLYAFQRMIQINLVGTFICIAKSTAGMLALEPFEEDAARGVVVNTASVAAEDGQAGQAAYSAAKAGIVGMTLAIARDFMMDGIRVNTILPGTFDTPLLHSAPEAVRQRLIDNVPYPRRMGHPAEYASLVLEVCRNAYLNGEDIRLDGALRMPPR